MTSYNVTMTVGQPQARQVLVDEQTLAQMQQEAKRRGDELTRLQAAMETLAAVNAPARFVAAALALVNELASRWQAERVGIGFLKGRYVRLLALSHTEKITRHMQVVQDIESAMEECLDQDIEVLCPPVADAGYVYRATEHLSLKHGPSAVCSLPLRRGGGVIGVLTVERKADRPLAVSEVETLRLTCDLFTARLSDLYETDKWIGAKAAREARRGLAWLVGAKHTWAKAAALAVLGVTTFSVLVRGPYNVESQFTLESTEKQVLSAPIDGVLKSVQVQVGDLVVTEQTRQKLQAVSGEGVVGLLPPLPPSVLAELDTSELASRLAGAEAERATYLQQASAAQKQGIEKQADVQMALAQAAKAKAQMDLYEWQIGQASVRTPIDGTVFAGDLKSRIGARVKVGDELFEVGEREQLRAELLVPEDEITELAVEQKGELAATSYPGVKIPFRVERIVPVASVVGTRNVYKVRVKFEPEDVRGWMKPGMGGVAKVKVGEERYGWLWTHRLINWVRMKLWI